MVWFWMQKSNMRYTEWERSIYKFKVCFYIYSNFEYKNLLFYWFNGNHHWNLLTSCPWTYVSPQVNIDQIINWNVCEKCKLRAKEIHKICINNLWSNIHIKILLVHFSWFNCPMKWIILNQMMMQFLSLECVNKSLF